MALNRYVLTSTVTIPWPATWDEVTNGGANTPVTTPAVPASGTAQFNASGGPVAVTVTGGTVTGISVNGTATGQTSGTVVVPAAGTIAITYSVAPTWSWAAFTGASGGAGTSVQVAATAPPGGQAGTIPQTTFIVGTAIILDPAGPLYAAIGGGNLRAFADGTDAVGHAALSN